MLSDDGVRRLAIAVLQQAVADLHSGIPETAAAPRRFIGRREDVDQFWCALVGLDGDAVRERLSEQVPRREEAADTPWSLTTEYATVFLSLRGVALRLEVARSPPRGAPSGPRPVGKCGTEANDHHSCDGRDPEPHNPPSYDAGAWAAQRVPHATHMTWRPGSGAARMCSRPSHPQPGQIGMYRGRSPSSSTSAADALRGSGHVERQCKSIAALTH
jgi:hypothetical protein